MLQAGAAVDPSLVGRRVLILPTFVQGTWGGQVVVRARDAVPVSEHADVLQLAMLPVNPAVAYALLNAYVTLAPGEWIGVTLANSGIGQYVIELAKRAGVRTLAIVRRRRRPSGCASSAPTWSSSTASTWATASPRRSETPGCGCSSTAAPGPRRAGASLADGGTVVTYAAVRGQPPVLPLGDLYRGVSLQAFNILTWIPRTPRATLERIYGELAELVEQGVLEAAVEATYPLEEYREALAQRPGPGGPARSSSPPARDWTRGPRVRGAFSRATLTDEPRRDQEVRAVRPAQRVRGPGSARGGRAGGPQPRACPARRAGDRQDRAPGLPRERAPGCRIARAVGVESELELSCAGLHQLCEPLLDRLERLPEPQRITLETAFGRRRGAAPPDDF